MKDIEILLLDIEGTVCSILFVKQTLYPYFNQRFADILQPLQYPLTPKPEQTEQDIINNIVCQFPATATHQELVTHIETLVQNDIKDPILKSFQGFVWKLGYEKGDIVAPIYPDAIELIKTFAQTKKVYIYSSGSVKAQKLLFKYVEEPGTKSTIDLNEYLSGYFDITTSGFKQDPSSYKNILASIGYTENPAKVLFLSDNVHEIRAAKQAQMNAIIVDRPGNNPLTKEDVDQYGVLTEFSSLTN